MGRRPFPADNRGMTSTSSATPWFPAPAAPAAPAPGPRHGGPEWQESPDRAALSAVVPPVGRHAAPDWNRQDFDARIDDDPFGWLGFAPEPA